MDEPSPSRAAAIRRLVPSDASVYRDLMLEAYERHPDAFTSSAAERLTLPMTWWEARVADGPVAREIVWGAFSDGRLTGVAGLSRESRRKVAHKAGLFGMYVQAGHRGRGLGSRLVEAVLCHARSEPALRVVQLTVTEGNLRARALYERHGFVAFGLEPLAVHVGAEFVSKVHMWCDVGRTAGESKTSAEGAAEPNAASDLRRRVVRP